MPIGIDLGRILRRAGGGWAANRDQTGRRWSSAPCRRLVDARTKVHYDRTVLPPKTTDKSVEALLSLGQALRAMQAARGGDRSWLALNLTMAQFKALLIVADTGGLTSRDLSRWLGIGPSAVTSLVDRLVERRLVRREDDPEDRRVAWVRPTSKALGLRDRLLETRRSVWTEIVESLPPSDREHLRQTCTRLVETAHDLLARSREKASA